MKRYRAEAIRRWISLGIVGLIVITGQFCLIERESQDANRTLGLHFGRDLVWPRLQE